MNKPFSDSGTVYPMSAESVNFKNGMIVTADDLGTAMMYPVSLMQTVNRAVFGCGVVCGFELKPDPELCGRTAPCDPCAKEGSDGNTLAYPNFIVQIGKGTALDCAGLPIEICKPQRFDLAPETCGCDTEGGTVCILVRRVSAPEAPRGDCCDPAGAVPACSRQRDHVEIRAFTRDKLPDHVCMREPDRPSDDDCGDQRASAPTGASGATAANNPDNQGPEVVVVTGTRRPSLCDCLKSCGDCDCCGEGWVLLGCVELCAGGIKVESLVDNRPYQLRQWIKPIACACGDNDVDHDDEKTVTGNVIQGTMLEKDARLMRVMLSEDPQINEKLASIVTTKNHLATFKAMDVRNLDHFELLIESRATMLKEALGLSQTSDRLDEYIEKAKEIRTKDIG